MSATQQNTLFDLPGELPDGLIYQPDFLTGAEEGALLEHFSGLPFKAALFQQYTARRRVVRFGEGEYPASYGRQAEESNPRLPIPDFLLDLRRKVAHWRGVPDSEFVHALVTEYQPGTPIGWHSDAPHFDVVVGVSLAGAARMRFRPYAAKTDRSAVIDLELEPRSIYVMQGDIRRRWQHQIPPTKALRYSITMRTMLRADLGSRRAVRKAPDQRAKP